MEFHSSGCGDLQYSCWGLVSCKYSVLIMMALEAACVCVDRLGVIKCLFSAQPQHRITTVVCGLTPYSIVFDSGLCWDPVQLLHCNHMTALSSLVGRSQLMFCYLLAFHFVHNYS